MQGRGIYQAPNRRTRKARPAVEVRTGGEKMSASAAFALEIVIGGFLLAAVVWRPVVLAPRSGHRIGKDLVLLGDAGMTEGGGVTAVGCPGRGSELVQAVVAGASS